MTKRKGFTAGAVAVGIVAGTVAALAPSAAYAGNGCYADQSDRVTADERAYGDSAAGARVWVSNPVLVTPGSPCRDVNLRGSWDSGARRSACIQYRVRFPHYDDPSRPVVGPWVTVCSGWRVAYTSAPEGEVFVVESRGAPGSVVVRS